jgi:hypothetical protein
MFSLGALLGWRDEKRGGLEMEDLGIFALFFDGIFVFFSDLGILSLRTREALQLHSFSLVCRILVWFLVRGSNWVARINRVRCGEFSRCPLRGFSPFGTRTSCISLINRYQPTLGQTALGRCLATKGPTKSCYTVLYKFLNRTCHSNIFYVF